MPPGRPLPFLTPTQPTGGLGGAPDISPADMEALQELLTSIQQPLPEVKRPGVGQRIAVSLGDALVAAAQVLSRGAGPSPQGGARLAAQTEAQEERRAEAESRNASLRQQATLSTFRDVQTEKRAATREEALLKRQAQQQELIEERQRQIDALKRAAEEKQLIVAQALEIANTKEGLPPGFDVNKATLSDILAIRQANAQRKGVSPDLAAMLATAKTLQAGNPDLQIKRIDLGDVELGTKEPDPLASQIPVTPPTARQASTYGVDTTGMTEEVARAEVAAARQKQIEAQQKEREGRLNKRTGRGEQTVRSEIVTLKSVIRNAQEALDLLNTKGDIGGPAAGRISPTLIALKDKFTGSDDAQNRIDLDAAISVVRTAIRNAIAGKAVTPYEGKEMEGQLPAISDIFAKKISNLEKMIETANKGIEDRIKTFGLSSEDVDFITNPNFVRSEPPPGAVRLGSTP